MQHDNVKISREAIDALGHGGIEAFLQFCDPEVEWITPPDWLEDRVLTGYDGVTYAIGRFAEQLDDFEVEIAEVIDLGGDRAVLLMYQQGRIKGSGHSLEQPLAVVADFRDGRALRLDVYFTWEEARRAAGLEG